MQFFHRRSQYVLFNPLMEILQSITETQGITAFQNAVGINVDTFLELLEVYLLATVPQYQGQHYVQRSGVSIGSRVAPKLCDLFLVACGKLIENNLKDPRVIPVAIFRYVDDFLVHCGMEIDDHASGCGHAAGQCFQENCPDLISTHESPVNRKIKFLVLGLTFTPGHVCWRYEPWSAKGFLPFTSEHSRTIKRSVAITALVSALHKSCRHQLSQSFGLQVSWLREATYPANTIGQEGNGTSMATPVANIF